MQVYGILHTHIPLDTCIRLVCRRCQPSYALQGYPSEKISSDTYHTRMDCRRCEALYSQLGQPMTHKRCYMYGFASECPLIWMMIWLVVYMNRHMPQEVTLLNMYGLSPVCTLIVICEQQLTVFV
jgi:hypothetical protein